MELGLPRAPDLPGPDVERIVHDPVENVLYVGLAEDGVWKSADQGNSWERFDDGIRVPRIEAMEFVAEERRLYVGTAGSGLYTRELDTELGLPGGDLPPADKPGELPPSYLRVRPLHASPLHGGEAAFEISLGRAAALDAAIFDLRGRRVRALRGGLLGVGAHELSWDLRDDAGSEVASGVYWLRAEANGRLASQKIVLAR
jgi:hypothetical protein